MFELLVNAVMSDRESITKDELTKKLMNMCTNIDVSLFAADMGMCVRLTMSLVLPAEVSNEDQYLHDKTDWGNENVS